MKYIFAILLLAIASITLSAQEQTATPKPADPPKVTETKEPVSKIEEPLAVCDLALQHSPLVDGTMQLGMPEAEAALKLNATFEADGAAGAGHKRVTAKLDRNPVFDNKVESGSLTSVNGKVNSIRFTYPAKFPTVKEFIQNAAPRLGLVRIAFRVDNERNEARIVCKDFTVDLKTTDRGSEILLTDTTAARKP